jgi:SAM-dependent methyltransferase
MGWFQSQFTTTNAPKMERRASIAAELIAPNTRVLDLGCGQMHLRKFLPSGCHWTGADLDPVLSEVQRIDLDRKEFPAGEFDYVVMLGLLHWIEQKQWVLTRAHQAAPALILNWRQYFAEPAPSEKDMADGESKLLGLLTATGWNIHDTKLVKEDKTHRTVVMVCHGVS